MSSSRSDVVTHFVSLSVTKEFFFKLKRYNGVSRKFKGGFNEILRMFQLFHASFKKRKFQGCFKKVSGVFQGRLKGILREF